MTLLSSMPSHFFHLKLELYSSPAASATSSKRLKTSHPPSNNIFLPPSGFHIFHEPLPIHKRNSWDSYIFPKPKEPLPVKHWTPSTPLTSTHSETPQRENSSEPPSPPHGDALLLPERTLNRRRIPSEPPRAPHPTKPSNSSAARDWRYDSVSIDSIDMESQYLRAGKGAPSSKTSGHGGLHTKGVYLPSDTKTTEVGWGVVHLFRDTEESARLAEESGKSVDWGKTGDDADDPLEDCTTVCILAVPSWMMPSDLLGFVGDQAREAVSHFRLVRTGRANKYMVLMKFRSSKKAREWQKAYNGRLFSAAEPENCHVVFIKSVEFISPDATSIESGDAAGSFPSNNRHDAFTTHTVHSSGASNSLTSKPLAPPPPNLQELPTCPVCLERMDETSGLLTILCQHVFHCACLEKWRFPGSGCPVCRYTQSPSYTFPYPRPQDGEQQDESEPVCSVCAADVNLWICLICGNIGCGRYDSAHAFAHYEATSHCYAMDIDTQRVWDYAGDGYVHRLIQSKPPFSTSSEPNPTTKFSPNAGGTGSADYPDRHANEAFRAEGGETVPREKMESMANEYTYLLTSQLEGQRRYFEEQVERAVDKASQASARADAAASAASLARSQAEGFEASRQTLQDSLARLEKQLEKSDKARARFEALARELTASLREEKAMNEGLLGRVKAADEKATAMREEAVAAGREMEELRETNRDLTMFISGQEKVRELQAQGEEVEDGSVSLPEPPPPPQSGKGGRKGKGRKK